MEERLALGEQLSRTVCATCHVYTEPDLVDKKNWREQILPRMSAWLGVFPVDFNAHPEGQLIKATGIYPEKPLLSQPEWALIEEYYLTRAPEVALPQDPKPEITVGLKLFKTEPPRHREAPPMTTLVRINPATHHIYIGDHSTKSLLVLDADGRYLNSVALGNIPVRLTLSSAGAYVTCIGSFSPSEVENGEIFFLGPDNGGFKEKKSIFQKLHRPVDLQFADLNGDGLEDAIVCNYGSLTGRLVWFENLGKERWVEHVILPKAGTLGTVLRDFNGDGFLDIATLRAQEAETLVILLNDGHGNFTARPVFQKPPAYGHSYFEVQDFNGDGRPDFLVTCGDNGEYSSPTKKYHGIRIYLNDGELRFHEAYFYPLNGAYRAMAADFDQDGDLDLAAVSFFPDYEKSPRESFVYLENQGGLKFTASTFRECIAGRWLSMDIGDLDGDGDSDIVLASFVRGPTAVPQFLADIWESRGGSIQILRNTLKSTK